LPADSRQTAWLPELVYTGGRFESNLALVSDETTGRVVSLAPPGETEESPRVVRLPGRALLPGLVNAHSHAFQRVIRGRTEWRTAARDTFWTWREQMYAAASRLTPEGLYDASRMAFMEMALSGVTSVGEFHYLHHAPEGTPYEDPNLLSKQVVRAARDVGIRIALLRVAYARAGFEKEPDPRQSRFITPDPATFLKHLDDLDSELSRDADDETAARRVEETDKRDVDGSAARHVEDSAAPVAWAGLAPHSVRAVPLEYLREVGAYASARRLPVHMHVSEQPAENESCLREHGRTPVRLLADEGLLGERFTAVHAVHVSADEARALVGSNVCACPTTERNLGDGVVPADLLLDSGVHLSLGSDSHTQIDLLEDARQLEYHLRLQKLSRAVLAPADSDQQESQTSALAARLFECATVSGARSVGSHGGKREPGSHGGERAFGSRGGAREPGSRGGALAPGSPADFFTVSLEDPSIAGAGPEDLLAAIVFSLARTALRETVVAGRPVVEAGRHAAQDEITARFAALQKELWR
jgi:formimidoylglutamate deiminase